MTRALALFAFVPLLASCSHAEPVPTAQVLAHDSQRLQSLRHRCAVARAQLGEATCRMADQAYSERFYLGLGGADEYQTPAELPAIPPTFDGDDDGGQP